jgi:hypothetical protein
MMTIEVLLLGITCGMTLLAYMIAINAHGSSRLILSYLIATCMLVGTVYGIVHYVNSDQDARKAAIFQQRLESEKRLIEERVTSQEEALKANQERLNGIAKLNIIITAGNTIASSMINLNLQDKSLEMDALIGRSAEFKRKTDQLKADYAKITLPKDTFDSATTLIKEALQLLTDASYYMRQYYYSEDTQQEQLRENLLRQKSRLAHEKFQKAGSLIVFN